MRVCQHCGQPLPASSSDRRRYCSERCSRAVYARARRTREQTSGDGRQLSVAKREAYGHAWVETAPDPAPAVRLRRLLADDREHGLAFEDAWPEDVRVVLRGLNRKDASQWAIVFSATESAWMTAYERSETQIISLDGDLLLDAAA